VKKQVVDALQEEMLDINKAAKKIEKKSAVAIRQIRTDDPRRIVPAKATLEKVAEEVKAKKSAKKPAKKAAKKSKK
jgi:hypothetical protein